MTDDLIYRKDIAERLERVIRYGLPDEDGYHCVSAESVLETVNKLPSAERKAGEWYQGVECSECGWVNEIESGIVGDASKFHFCPNCGARMESD